jgi:hypothetical protein
MLMSVSALLQYGCATVTRGTSEQLKINSTPQGAQVRVSNGFTGTTPAIFTVPRKGDLYVTVSKEGYETANISVTTKIAGAGAAGFAGNILIGGIIGGGVDIATGATLSHRPNPIEVTLVPVPPPAAATASTTAISSVTGPALADAAAPAAGQKPRPPNPPIGPP